MKSKFLAGSIATLIALIVVVGLSLFLALVLDIDASENWFTTTAAFVTISVWVGMYALLKPKTDPKLDAEGNTTEKVVNQLDDNEFKQAYLVNTAKTMRIGWILGLICLSGLVCVLVFSEDLGSPGSIVGLALLSLFTSVGMLILVKATNHRNRIKQGTDPLMNAISNDTKDHVIWYYGRITEQQGTAFKHVKTYHIFVFTKESKKPISLVLKKEKVFDELLAFLKNKFPDSVSESNESTKTQMKEEYGFKA